MLENQGIYFGNSTMKLRANIFMETSTFFGLIFYNQVQFLNFAKRRSVDQYETPFKEKFD